MYNVVKVDNCPIETPMKILLETDIFPGGIIFFGHIQIANNISGELTFAIESTRCSLDLKLCEKWKTFNIKDVCKRIEDKNKFYSELFSSIEPKLECPFKAGNYTIDRALVDLVVLRFLPMDGFIWILTGKLVTSEKGSKIKKVIACLIFEMKVTRGNQRI